MRYVIIGSSGHHHQVTDAMRAGSCPPPIGVAPGDAGEDVSGLALETGAKRFDSWTEMLSELSPELAVVNSWYGHMAEKTIECLKRGIHVFSEKPLATELKDLERLQAAYEAGSAALGCMLGLNCCGWFRTTQAAIGDGLIGEVRLLHGQKSYRMGTRGPQYQKREDYGGTIPWVGMHAIDWLLRLGGPCEQVSAFHSSACNGNNGSMEATASVLMRLKGGVIASADLDYLRPTGSARHDDDRLRVTGTRGMIEVIDGRVYLENELPRRELTLLPEENPFMRFLRCIGTPEGDALAREAIEDTRICLLARESADKNITIFCS